MQPPSVVGAMSVRTVKAFFPASGPESGLYQGLADATPPKSRRLALVERSAAERRPRALTDAQRGTILGPAALRIRQEAKDRTARFLRRLDTRHSSGCRTKQQVWNNLAALAEPILARLDLASMCLGWLDMKSGQFNVNRQRGLAEDSGLSECAVSRTFKALEQAGYVYRKVSRIYKRGKNWVTRSLIKIRPRLFIDLGLGYQFSKERTRRRTKRAKQLGGLGMRAIDIAARNAAEARERKASHKAAKAARKAEDDKAREAAKVEYSRRYNERRTAFRSGYTGPMGQAFERAFAKAHPDYRNHPDLQYKA